jgi:hypothetical protein
MMHNFEINVSPLAKIFLSQTGTFVTLLEGLLVRMKTWKEGSGGGKYQVRIFFGSPLAHPHLRVTVVDVGNLRVSLDGLRGAVIDSLEMQHGGELL